MRPSTIARIRTTSLLAAVVAWFALGVLAWAVGSDWRQQPDVSAPLTRTLLFYHPASAWAAFVAYFGVFALSIAYLNERDLRFDRPAYAAAEVGFVFNTIALLTGTAWGVAEWAETGENALATVYSEPKVLVVLVMWLTFAAYLLLRRFIDHPARRARLSAVFGILGALGAPLSFLTSRVLATSLHPDIAGPGANPDAALGASVGAVLGFSFLAATLLVVALFFQRLRLLDLAARLEARETA